MKSLQCVQKEARYNMLLAPFQPMTRIELETYVNTVTECYLVLRNPANKPLKITVTKVPPAERHITLNLTELEIQENNSDTIYIKWIPKETGCWRDVIQITDSRRIKYDIIISTTAKCIKKSCGTRKKQLNLPLSKSRDFISTSNKKLCQNKILKVPANNQSSFASSNVQSKLKSKYDNDLNKENNFSKCNETNICTSHKQNDRIEMNYHEYHNTIPDNILSEQHTNVWNDESVLPQVLSPSNTLHEIRRATYVKEIGHDRNILCEQKEEIIEDITCPKDEPQSEFSILMNKFVFATSNEISSSPQPVSESTDSINSQNTDKYKTFNISYSNLFDASTISDAKNPIETLPVSQLSSMHNLSPIKSDEYSHMSNTTQLIASSPVINIQYHDKDRSPIQSLLENPNKLNHFVVNVNDNTKTNECEYFNFDTISKDNVTINKTEEMYIEISPPKKHFHNKSLSILRHPTARSGKVTKDKMFREGKNTKFHLNIPLTKKNTKSVPAIRISKLSLNTLRKTKLYTSSSSRESSFKLQDTEEYYIFQEDPFAASTTEDPFLKNTLHYNEKWLLQQEIILAKWLNVLLSSPEDLSVDIETDVTDVGKIWQSSKIQKESILAETKEAVSARYHTNTRLNTLRKAARVMYNRNEVTQILSRTTTCITKGILCIRSDRNLHRDIGLQKFVLSLFLSYNPLWLRIGLETVYGESISLRSNNDVIGLTRFLLTRFFSDPRLINMPGYHKTDPNQKFINQLNKFILKKFLFLVYFLDYAKQHKLIGHDPCLFYKRAMYKESREILLCFAREVLSGIGDVTRLLRNYDYILVHRQTFIEEYDYAVMDIRRDLRDGIRLCRVMELITGAQGLTQRCRAPAISRLQKVYNVDMALNALSKTGYVLESDIDAKNIADGHREKTLSLLWRIIHKYQTPRFDRAARIIQKWWRAQLYYIRIKNYLYERRNLAAIVIQHAWYRKKIHYNYTKITELKERKNFLRVRIAAIDIQRWWRNVRGRLYELKKRRKAAIVLQRKWRATILMRKQKNLYYNIKNVVLTIQTRWRATRTMKIQRTKYLIYKTAALRIQLWWRSIKLMQQHRERFLRSKESIRTIQIWWRTHLLVRKERNDFLRTRAAVATIKIWWINMVYRKKFLLLRKSTILIQKTWREYQIRKREAACLKIQSWWKGVTCLRRYKLQISSCTKLQHWWRAIKVARHQRATFLQIKNTALIVQKNWRRKVIRRHYLKQQEAAVLIQLWYRRVNSKRLIRVRYLKIRNATVLIQNCWRSFTARRYFIAYRKAAVIIQSYYKMRIAMRRYETAKYAAWIIQSYWRAYVIGRHERLYYLSLQEATIRIQRRYRQKKSKSSCKKLHQQNNLISIATKIQNECGKVIQVDQNVTMNLALPESDYWQNIISVIRNCNSVGMLLVSLNSLDTILKLSPTVCIILCELNLVDEIYNMIAQSNRSLPWMKVCLQACSILITLAKYPYTRKYIVKKEYALTLVKLLSGTLKEKKVFLHCATLIWLIGQDEDYIKTMTMCPQIQWLLKNIQHKVLKDSTKFEKWMELKKLYPSCEPTWSDTQRPQLFTDMSFATAVIIKRICTY